MDIVHYDLIELASSYSVHLFPSDITSVLAQVIEDADILGDMEAAWRNFIESGQVWALIIGLFIGYVFKGFTSY